MQFDRTRVGTIAFATDIVDSFYLNTYQNKEGVINALNFYNKVREAGSPGGGHCVSAGAVGTGPASVETPRKAGICRGWGTARGLVPQGQGNHVTPVTLGPTSVAMGHRVTLGSAGVGTPRGGSLSHALVTPGTSWDVRLEGPES